MRVGAKRTMLDDSNEPHAARRTTAAFLAGVVLMQNAACGSVPKQSEMHMGCGKDAHALRDDVKDTPSDRQTVFEYQKSRDSRCALSAPPQRYTVAVSVEWSNGWTENLEITNDLNAEAGQHYVVVAYEKNKGQAPLTDVRLHGYVTTPAKILIYALAAPVAVAMVILTLPFTIPASFIGRQDKAVEKPTDRPSKDCCYVWIEHGSTGEVLAGTAVPVGVRSLAEPSPRK